MTSTASTPAARSQSASPAPAGPAPLEARVRRRVLALVEDRLQRRPVQVRVQLDPAGADHAVRRPGVDVVRVRRRSARPGRCGGPGSRPRGRSRLARRCAVIAAATAAPPATASEPPSQKSFCTSTTISARRHRDSLQQARSAGPARPADSFSPSHGTDRSAPAQPCSRAAPSVGRVARRPACRRAPAAPAAAGRAAPSSGAARGRPAPPRSPCRSPGAGARAVFRPPLGGLVLRPLRHRPPVHLDQLVDHAGGRRAGAGDQRGAHPVHVDRRGRPAPAIAYSSRSPETTIRVPVAPSESSSSRACWASTVRSPESIRIAPQRRARPPRSRSGCPGRCRRCRPAAWCRSRARRPGPGTRSASSSCSSVNACAAVPVVGTP